uniref:Uncharacterized protein n=1 Tax=Globisporangium ultimum (strain ATCC 200006 / CBS 805.95 / DAOM BR144) TaxID=431595 RepID=K3W887_GLOUD
MDEELQRTLAELCDDLLSLSVTSLDDANAILHSLTLLASVSLGRLAFDHEVRDDATKLSELASRFMYLPETAHNAIALFAALAKGNPVNQQRIVRRTPGVQVARNSVLHANNSETGSDIHGHTGEERMTVFDAGKIKKKKRKTHIPVLYALTEMAQASTTTSESTPAERDSAPARRRSCAMPLQRVSRG